VFLQKKSLLWIMILTIFSWIGKSEIVLGYTECTLFDLAPQ
jgi:hypothetical protein